MGFAGESSRVNAARVRSDPDQDRRLALSMSGPTTRRLVAGSYFRPLRRPLERDMPQGTTECVVLGKNKTNGPVPFPCSFPCSDERDGLRGSMSKAMPSCCFATQTLKAASGAPGNVVGHSPFCNEGHWTRHCATNPSKKVHPPRDDTLRTARTCSRHRFLRVVRCRLGNILSLSNVPGIHQISAPVQQ